MIPKSFMEKYLDEAKNSTLFGVKLIDMTKEELMVTAAAGWAAKTKAIEDASKQRDFFKKFSRRK